MSSRSRPARGKLLLHRVSKREAMANGEKGSGDEYSGRKAW